MAPVRSAAANLTDQFISTNQFGYDIDKISATGLNVSLTSGQTYWINLQNASVPSGDPVFWDENSGVGCQSPGCPSQAYESSVGTIASEAFDITGECDFCHPPCFQSGGNMQIIHEFSGQGDGSFPTGAVADAAGNVYGSSSGGDTGFGLVYQLALKGQGWVFNTLYNFAGGSGGSSPGTPIVGPQGTLYGTANGGMQNCGQNNTDYCGLIYNLRPAPTPCTTSSCPWTKSVVYQPTGNNDAYDPGNLVFDEAGNLYGTSGSGGAYGQGAVFELTFSNGGWTETILYNFTGGSDGAGPGSLTLGGDGNLYGTGGGNAYPYGMVFQLVRPPSGGSWTENVIHTFAGQQDGQDPYGLVQGGLGSLVGLSNVGTRRQRLPAVAVAGKLGIQRDRFCFQTPPSRIASWHGIGVTCTSPTGSAPGKNVTKEEVGWACCGFRTKGFLTYGLPGTRSIPMASWGSTPTAMSMARPRDVETTRGPCGRYRSRNP